MLYTKKISVKWNPKTKKYYESLGYTFTKIGDNFEIDWNDNPNERYDINNGITLCEKCHYSFHSLYGKKCNTQEHLDSFLDMRKKLC